MKYSISLLIIIVLSISACTSLKKTAVFSPEEVKKNQIVFHQFKARQESGNITIGEVERTLRDGRIKDLNNDAGRFHHPVELVFLDQSENRLKSIFIEHPLIREDEYVGQDDQLKRITSYEDSAIFTVRYNSLEQLRNIYFASDNTDTLSIQVKLKISK